MSLTATSWYAALAAFRTAWRELLAADIIYKLAAALLLLPAVAVALSVFLALSGSAVRADQDIALFFASPLGLVTLVVVAAATIGVTALEAACLMTIGLGAREAVRVSVPDALRYALARTWRILQVAARLVVRVLVLCLPFLLVAGALALWLLTEHDINYYLAERPPEFLAAAGAIGVLLLGLTILLLPRLVDWSLVLPIVLFEDVRPADSFATSRERVRGHRGQIALILVTWALAGLLMGALVLGAARAAGLGLTDLLAGRVETLLLAMAVLLVTWIVASILVNVFTTCLFALLIVALYRRLGGREWTPAMYPARAAAGGHRGLLAANALLLLFGVATGIAVLASSALLATAREPRSVVVTAHRGAAGDAPENTLASVRAALEQGADWVEIDVQETADGEVVVIHDSDFMKIAGNPLKIWDARTEDLADLDIGSWYDPAFAGERVPTLAEVLEEVRGRATLTIELKYYGHDERLEERVVEIVEAAGMADDVVIISLKYAGLQKLRALRPDWPVGLLTARALGDLTTMDVDFLAVNTALATRGFIRRAGRAGKDVFVWTVNDPVGMSVMAGRGAAGLITDYPETARMVLDRRASLGTLERVLMDLSLAMGARPTDDDVTRETAGAGS